MRASCQAPASAKRRRRAGDPEESADELAVVEERRGGRPVEQRRDAVARGGAASDRYSSLPSARTERRAGRRRRSRQQVAARRAPDSDEAKTVAGSRGTGELSAGERDLDAGELAQLARPAVVDAPAEEQPETGARRADRHVVGHADQLMHDAAAP